MQLNADSIQTEAIANYEGRFHNLKAFDYNLKLKEFYYEFTDEDISEPAQVEDNKSLNNLRFRHTKKLKYLHDNFVEVESCDFIDLKE